MLALAATNFVGVVLFAAVYAAAGARYLSQTGFLACFLLIFVLVTGLWVRTEGRHQALDPLQRVGRVGVGLAVVIVGVPITVLLPLFWLESHLPCEAGLGGVLAPAMTLVLIALVLVVVVNLIGAIVLAVAALLRRHCRASPP